MDPFPFTIILRDDKVEKSKDKEITKPKPPISPAKRRQMRNKKKSNN